MSLRATAETLEVKLDTAGKWWYVAAEHCKEVNKVLMKDLNVSKVEIEELWTFA